MIDKKSFRHCRYFVTTYGVAQEYGGCEEGGWYYRVIEAEEVMVFSSKKKASKYLGNLYRKLYEESYMYDGEDKPYYRFETRKTLCSEDNTNKPRPTYC